MTRFLRMWIVLAVFALVAAACGGGDDSAADTTAATSSAPATTAPGAPATTAPDAPATTASPATTAAEEPSNGGGGGGTSPNIAIVTINGATYEFDAEQHLVGRCDPNFFGAFWVLAALSDGSGRAGLEMFIVPDGDTNHNETSRVRVGLEDIEGREWVADEDGGQGAVAGESRVETVEWNGNTVSGTATFVDLEMGDGATAEGTFEATCP